MVRLHRAETGWLAELAVDRAVVQETGGGLVPWNPLIDAHGVDRAYSWKGIGKPVFVQVKTTGFADEEGRYRWELRAASLPDHDRFFVVLSISDLRLLPQREVYWCLDSKTVRRLARREYNRALRTDIYRLDGSPSHQDRLAPYRCTREQLWRRLSAADRQSAPLPLRFPILRIDQGGLYEFTTITDIMAGNRKDLLLFRPAFDLHGRDLLLQLVGSSDAFYLQIKGTAVRRGTDLVRFHIRRSTFVPADDFLVAMVYWDPRSHAPFPERWLVPSTELQRRTAHQRDRHYLTVDARLDATVDRWAEWRHSASELADVLRKAFSDLERAA